MIEKMLKERFGFTSFRPGQKNVIEDVIAGLDVFAMLPTGSGKSLCYLLPGYVMDGLVVIVSPLLSLMEDQCQQIKMLGEKRVAALNSFLNPQEKALVIKELNKLKFLYVSPEMLQSQRLIARLVKLKVSLFVVDEAHCISQWGREFRPDYLKLANIRTTLGSPPCLALTATANDRVRQDILRQLGIENAQEHIYSVDRDNIALIVQKTLTIRDKIEKMIDILKRTKTPGIIYCASRDWTERLSDLIGKETGLRVAYYHGGLTTHDRLLIQHQFLNDQLDIICCTNAFGMGINKPNVRLILHFHYPKHMNAYIQEIGRAGRDGKQCVALTLYTADDDAIPLSLIEKGYPDQAMLFRILKRLDHTGMTTESDATLAIMVEEGASDAAAQFLHHQLAENQAGTTDLIQLAKEIGQTIDERKHQKIKDLYEIKAWLEDKGCRREGYLKSFGEDITKSVVHCCDHCGAMMKTFDHHPNVQPKEPSVVTWEMRLRTLLVKEMGTSCQISGNS